MDMILDMTRELAEAMQQDERFIKLQMAQSAADEDDELQGMIGEFNLKRIALNNEVSKEGEEKDGEKIRELDKELRETYARLMDNDHMKGYQSAKADLDLLVNKMMRVITLASQGEDPYTVDVDSACSGNCSSCGGCH